jgi:hypothetical protein
MFRLNPPTFSKTQAYLQGLANKNFRNVLRSVGQYGVDRLSEMTPIDTGETASSWSYDITIRRGRAFIVWTNSVMAGSTPLVILLRYGYGTGTGGYVRARNFITPAMEEVLAEIQDKIAAEVIR